MKQHSTNYYNTLITVAEDCKLDKGTPPPEKEGKKTIANYQFDILSKQPFKYTSDDLIFDVFAIRNDMGKAEYDKARALFYSRGQACMRTSPLAKNYAWGIYYNDKGYMKLVDSASEEYERLLADDSIKKVPAMKSKK